MEETLGLDYPDTVTFTVKFVTGLAHQHKNQEAIEIAERAEERARKAFGPDHPLTRRYERLLQGRKLSIDVDSSCRSNILDCAGAT